MESRDIQHWISNYDKNLTHSWNDNSFISKVILQLNKDFTPYSSDLFEVDLDTKIASKSFLIETIKNTLINLEKENSAALPQLLYTIDIPENIFHQILNSSASFYEVLAEAILIREAYKVWIRITFS